ncbi:MAG: hypothetical protein M1840_008722 [Geoglossum simile]|nr:MAG: hypothetical protein M1840_008722 [Geoglossum simile]
MDRASRLTDAAPSSNTRSRRGRAEDFFDSSAAGRNGDPTTKDTKTTGKTRSRSPGDRGQRRNERERSASPARGEHLLITGTDYNLTCASLILGSHTRASRKRDGDDTRTSGRYERERSRDRDRDRRYRSRSRDRYDRRRERSRSREREHRDRSGKDKDRERDRDRSDKKLTERSGGRDTKHSGSDAPKSASSRHHNPTRSTSPPVAVSPRQRTRTGSPKRGGSKPKPDSYKHTPLPSIESPSFTGGDGGMEVSEDSGRLEGGDESNDVQAQMRALMGFKDFGTTKQKKVPGNNIYGVRKDKKTEYRQNRVGGFNRPLSPS